jgi:hypothetical protein
MPWGALLRATGRGGMARYRNLTLRFEDAAGPQWVARLYDGETAIGEASAGSPREAVEELVKVAQQYLRDPSVGIESFSWVQLSH